MQFLKQLWLSYRSNPYIVAFEGGAGAAAINFMSDVLQQGSLNVTKAGIQKLIAAVLIGGFTAVRLLYRPTPGAPPTK